MTRLLTDGAECGNTSRADVINPVGGTPTVSSGVKRTGGYSYSMPHNNGTSYLEFNVTASTEFYFRVAFYVNTYNAGSRFIEFMNGTSESGSMRLSIQPNGTETVTVYDGTTLRLTSPTLVWNVNEWHVLELHYKHAANPDGVIELKYDGVLVGTFTGATNTQSQTNRVRLYSDSANVYQTYYDDIAFNDTNGSVDNSWCGDGGVLSPLVPTSTGTYVGFLASGSATTWQSVDEIPPNTTDFAYTSVSGTVTTFNTSSLSGLPAGASISRVWIELSAKESAATGDYIATFLRSGITNVTGTAQGLTLSYVRLRSNEYLTNPDTSGTWSVSAVNSVEPGMVAE